MKPFSPVEAAHAQGASQALWNSAKKLAKLADVSATLPGLSPTENFERILRAVKTRQRNAQEQFNLMANAMKKANLILRFPRFTNPDE